MKTILKYTIPAILVGLFFASVSNAQVSPANFWKLISGVVQPIQSTWNIYAPANLRFDGEIQPDGSTCSAGQILKKTGSNDWDCAEDNSGGSGAVANGKPGFVTRYTGTSTISTGILLDNATISGVNATSSTVSFTVQGTGALNPFNVSSSSGTSYLTVASNGLVGVNSSTPIGTLAVRGQAGSTAPLVIASSTGTILLQVNANGSTTISSLGAGLVRSTSGGGLYTDSTSYLSSAITSLGGQTGATQTFSTSTTATGLVLNITSGSNDHNWALALSSGYNIPLTASTTNWNTFYDTPSNRITAGTNLAWSGNTLNGIMASSTIIAGGTATHSPSITFATSTDTNLLLSVVCATATCTFNPSWTGVLSIARGGTATTSAPTVAGQLLTSHGTTWGVANLVAGSNITITTSTLGQITITGAGGAGGSTTTITSNVQTDGPNFTFATGTMTGLDLKISGSGSTVTFAPSLQTGYVIPLSASTTQWTGLYNNVLSRLAIATGTAGSNFHISTTTNSITINCPNASGSVRGCLSTTDWTTFNDKQDALGGGTPGFNAIWNSFSGLTVGKLMDNGSVVGVNATSSTVNLTVRGSGTLNPFNVASSSGTSILFVTSDGNVGIGTSTPATPLVVVGSTTLSSLTAANCDVKSTTGGSLYCGVDATGSSTGNAAWTILSGLIHNATSTDSVLIGTTTPTTAKLFVQGNGAKNALVIASSSGTTQLTIDTKGNITQNAPYSKFGDASPLFPLAGPGLELWCDDNSINGCLIGTGNRNSGTSAYTGFFLNNNIANAAVTNYAGMFLNSSTYTDTTFGNAIAAANQFVIQNTMGPLTISSATTTAGEFISFLVGGNSTGNEAMRITENRLVGIGTTSPIATLAIKGTSTLGTTMPFAVASSSGTTLFQITASAQILTCTTCRLTIPQGTAPTLSAAGDIAVDTSNGGMFSFYANGRENLTATSTKGAFIESPTASENIILYHVNQPITITRVTCTILSTVSNAPSWTFSLPHDTTAAGAAANVMSSGQACTSTTTPQTITIGGDLTLAAGEILRATSSAVSNASSTLIQVYFKYDN